MENAEYHEHLTATTATMPGGQVHVQAWPAVRGQLFELLRGVSAVAGTPMDVNDTPQEPPYEPVPTLDWDAVAAQIGGELMPSAAQTAISGLTTTLAEWLAEEPQLQYEETEWEQVDFDSVAVESEFVVPEHHPERGTVLILFPAFQLQCYSAQMSSHRGLCGLEASQLVTIPIGPHGQTERCTQHIDQSLLNVLMHSSIDVHSRHHAAPAAVPVL